MKRVLKMFRRSLKPVATAALRNGSKCFSISLTCNFKVVVAGASGGIGQPLCLLLNQNPLVTQLALYDVAPMTPGVGIDLSHIDSPVVVRGYKGPEQLPFAIKDADVVLIPAGKPRKPGMTRADLFKSNASIVYDLMQTVACCAPKSIVGIITNPVNATLPIACEVMKKYGVFDPKRIIGITTLDIVRSSTFVAELTGMDPRCISIPVICGHSGITIIPLISQSEPHGILTDKCTIANVTKRIQEAGTEVVKAKAGFGSATLSMAYSGARLANAILRGLRGEPKVIECSMVQSPVCATVPYFSSPLLFGRTGIEKIYDMGKLSEFEKEQLQKALPELAKNIKTGEMFARK